jgi:hypothetical protein
MLNFVNSSLFTVTIILYFCVAFTSHIGSAPFVKLIINSQQKQNPSIFCSFFDDFAAVLIEVISTVS